MPGSSPRCPHAKKCGGCQLQNLSYPQQLQYKQVKCIRLLGSFCHVDEILGMETPYHYRNKVQAAFARTRGGKIISGVYQAASRRVVAVESCLIEDEKADEIIGTVRMLLGQFHLLPYDPDTGKGFLRHVLVKRGFKSGQIMVVLVTGSPVFPGKQAFVRALLNKHPEITTILQNVNGAHTGLVLGEREFVLYGPGKIEEQLGDCTFQISAKAFYQINPVQTEVLYKKALEFAALDGTQTVIDAYCGTGTIGIFAAGRAKQVIGVELNGDAVSDARENAKLNDVQNIRFFKADAGEFMTGMAKAGEKADVVLMDPPRAGSDRAFLSSLLTLAPKRVVYVSCNPETLRRDLVFLSKNGYRVRKIQPVDMFPHTKHIETVAVLSRKSATKTFIPVTVSPKDMGLDEAKAQPTYENIRKYVKETHGLTVSTLNIAQMKAECGLEMECDRSGGKQQPKCPPEKREAILDAFRHFGMIEDDSSEG